MKTSKTLCFLSLVTAAVFFTSSQGRAQLFNYGRGPTKPGTHAPIITHAFAVDKGYYGYIWKIYIEAEDPDGEMLRIASVVDHVGVGRYPTDWIYLKPESRKHFKGYIQWNTFSSKTAYLPEWTQITLRVS